VKKILTNVKPKQNYTNFCLIDDLFIGIKYINNRRPSVTDCEIALTPIVSVLYFWRESISSNSFYEKFMILLFLMM
jgi:hypothetical protein